MSSEHNLGIPILGSYPTDVLRMRSVTSTLHHSLQLQKPGNLWATMHLHTLEHHTVVEVRAPYGPGWAVCCAAK